MKRIMKKNPRRRNGRRKGGQKILKAVWAFKAKGKELVDKKNVQLDFSRKSQERTTKKRVGRRILQVVKSKFPGTN
jgi:hypothetical protein